MSSKIEIKKTNQNSCQCLTRNSEFLNFFYCFDFTLHMSSHKLRIRTAASRLLLIYWSLLSRLHSQVKDSIKLGLLAHQSSQRPSEEETQENLTPTRLLPIFLLMAPPADGETPPPHPIAESIASTRSGSGSQPSLSPSSSVTPPLFQVLISRPYDRFLMVPRWWWWWPAHYNSKFEKK